MVSRIVFALGVVGLIAIVIAASWWSSPATAQDGEPDLAATLAVLQTEIDALERQIAERETTAVQGTPPAVAGDTTVAGDGVALLPSSDPGEVAAVLVGDYSAGEWLPAIMHNNTASAYEMVGGTVIARTADGSLVASGEGWRWVPFRVDPGGYALVFFRFGEETLPEGLVFEIVPGWNELGESSSQRQDLVIDELTVLDDRVIGVVRNPSAVPLSAGNVGVVCLDDAGAVAGWGYGALQSASVAPSGVAAFDLQLTVGAACPHPVVAAEAPFER